MVGYAEVKVDRKRALKDFRYFARCIYSKPDRCAFDAAFHGILCLMVEHGASRELPPGDYYYETREDLVEASKVDFFTDDYKISDPSKISLAKRLREGQTNLDGSWRGIFVRVVPSKDCDLRLNLLPRGHLKTTLLTQARKLWRSLATPPPST